MAYVSPRVHSYLRWSPAAPRAHVANHVLGGVLWAHLILLGNVVPRAFERIAYADPAR